MNFPPPLTRREEEVVETYEQEREATVANQHLRISSLESTVERQQAEIEYLLYESEGLDVENGYLRGELQEREAAWQTRMGLMQAQLQGHMDELDDVGKREATQFFRAERKRERRALRRHAAESDDSSAEGQEEEQAYTAGGKEQEEDAHKEGEEEHRAEGRQVHSLHTSLTAGLLGAPFRHHEKEQQDELQQERQRLAENFCRVALMSGPSRTRSEQKQDLKWHRAALQALERRLRDVEHLLYCCDQQRDFLVKDSVKVDAENASLRIQLLNASSAAETRELELQELRKRVAVMPCKLITAEANWRKTAFEEIAWRKEELRELRGRAEDSSDSEADLEAGSGDEEDNGAYSEGQTERADTDGGRDSDDGGEEYRYD
jgi:hypothetical protein